MEKAEHLNSSRFVNLVKSGGGLCGGQLPFRYFVQRHFHPRRYGNGTVRFCSSRLAEPYVSFVLLLEGRLDFGINRRRFRIDADGGKIVLIAVGEEVLFSRYLYRGGKTVKMTIKGMEQWLPRPEYARFAPCFTANRSGYGICPKPARLGGILPANRPKGAFGRNIAPRGGRVAAAVGFVGHGFRRHRAGGGANGGSRRYAV